MYYIEEYIYARCKLLASYSAELNTYGFWDHLTALSTAAGYKYTKAQYTSADSSARTYFESKGKTWLPPTGATYKGALDAVIVLGKGLPDVDVDWVLANTKSRHDARKTTQNTKKKTTQPTAKKTEELVLPESKTFAKVISDAPVPVSRKRITSEDLKAEMLTEIAEIVDYYVNEWGPAIVTHWFEEELSASGSAERFVEKLLLVQEAVQSQRKALA